MVFFILFILYSIIVFIGGAVFGSEATDVRIVKEIERHGSFRIKPSVYLAERRNYKDSYELQEQAITSPKLTKQKVEPNNESI